MIRETVRAYLREHHGRAEKMHWIGPYWLKVAVSRNYPMMETVFIRFADPDFFDKVDEAMR